MFMITKKQMAIYSALFSDMFYPLYEEYTKGALLQSIHLLSDWANKKPWNTTCKSTLTQLREEECNTNKGKFIVHAADVVGKN